MPAGDFDSPLAEVEIDTTTVQTEAEMIGITIITNSLKCCACPTGIVIPDNDKKNVKRQNNRYKIKQKLKNTTQNWYIKFYIQLFDNNLQKVYLSCYNEMVNKICDILDIRNKDMTPDELKDAILKHEEHFLIVYDTIK